LEVELLVLYVPLVELSPKVVTIEFILLQGLELLEVKSAGSGPYIANVDYLVVAGGGGGGGGRGGGGGAGGFREAIQLQEIMAVTQQAL
jgi:hypothetical protein